MGTATYKLGKYGFLESDNVGITLLDITSILSQMPKNTVISSIKTLPVQGLTLTFEIELTNPIFKDGGEIIDNSSWSRSIGFDCRGNIVEFNNNKDFDLKDVVRTYNDYELEKKEFEDETL